MTALPAQAAESSGVTAEDEQILTRVFGYEPSESEIDAYLQRYGAVPSADEVAAYVAAAESEEAGVTVAPEAPFAGRVSVAAADSFSSFFQSGAWITRDGMLSLSLMPRAGGIGNEGGTRTWTTVYNTFSGSPNWWNHSHNVTASMSKQYNCHFRFGMVKTPWNLEPAKIAENVSTITCN
ncbi:DUF2599 domain-containing protein [Microbacterium sp. W1N]|uniref:DUF2599 domain-containing protein n=1 Tax=Microbacterium festucae TaxID=2977531 RepID=UPI0021BF8D9F|nr:DUF2599 domain-containing protein [Microbacterium festucae]MCT9819294.1 DUF2599 domain-containing protein [Microbacterium festucae]